METKYLVRTYTPILIGDILLEVNRFDKEDYVIFKALEKNGAKVEVISKSDKSNYRIGSILGADNGIDNYSRCKWLLYKLKLGSLLYGNKSI